MPKKDTLIWCIALMGLLGGCASVTSSSYQKGVDAGYTQRESDDAKRRYWTARHAESRNRANGQRTVWYVFDETGRTDKAGQVKPAGTTVAVPITEPEPVK